MRIELRRDEILAVNLPNDQEVQHAENNESALAKALPEILNTAMQLYVAYKEQERADAKRALELVTTHDYRIISVLVIFAGSILAVMAFLAYFDKVSGDALLFAVGSGFGYIFALIQKFLLSPKVTNGQSEN